MLSEFCTVFFILHGTNEVNVYGCCAGSANRSNPGERRQLMLVNRSKRAWPGIEPGTSSRLRIALRRNHTTRPPGLEKCIAITYMISFTLIGFAKHVHPLQNTFVMSCRSYILKAKFIRLGTVLADCEWRHVGH